MICCIVYVFLCKSVLVKARFWGVTFFSSLFGLPARWELHFLKENAKAINCLYSVNRPLQHFFNDRINRKSLVSLVITAGGAKCLIFLFPMRQTTLVLSRSWHDQSELHGDHQREWESKCFFFFGNTIKFQLIASVLQLYTLLSSQNTIWY